MSGSVAAVLARPLEDDFDTRADPDGVLRRLELHVVDDPASESRGLREGEILVTGFGAQTASALELASAMPRLRWVHSMYAGFEDLLAEPLLERQIVATSSAGAYGEAMAEYAFAAMVLLARRIPELFVAASHRQWRELHPLGIELAGRRVGIVGYGATGHALARRCAASGMSIWGVRRRADLEQNDPAERVLPVDRVGELLAASDFVVIAASLNRSSRGVLGSRQFEAMRQGAYLVNVARGALVDQQALTQALRSGRLAGAIVDVALVEPLPEQSELWDVPNLWLTPHMSGGTAESRARAFEILVANCRAYLDGRLDQLQNRVDLPFELGLNERMAC
jgi:phosphoglycerate dehydrogenase-like enzyme